MKRLFMILRMIPLVGCAVIAVVTSLCSNTARAETRTWTSVKGSKLEAEFDKLKPGNVVSLRLASGTMKDVKLDLLSQPDQDYVRQLTGTADAKPQVTDKPAVSKTSVSTAKDPDAARNLKSLKSQAQSCQTADEAVLLYELFLNNGSLPADVKAAAEQERAEWQRKAKDGLEHFGTKWVTKSEVKAAQTQAYYTIQNARDLIGLNQQQLAIDKLLEASKADPESIQADFYLATLYAVLYKRYDKAIEHYRTCSRRDPGNIAVLNNLALSQLKLNKFNEAVASWRLACKERYDERIIQNMGRMLEQAGKQRLPVTKDTLQSLNKVYASMIVPNRMRGASSGIGWLYMIPPRVEPPDEESSVPRSTAGDGEDGEAEVSAIETGVVVQPKLVLTSARLVKNAKEFKITGSGRRLSAKLVQSSREANLALLRCDELDAPALPLEMVPVGLDTPVQLSGYRPAEGLNAQPQAIRGTVLASPESSLEHLLFYKVNGETGFSGGPVCSNTGNLVALHVKNLSILQQSSGGGVPAVTIATWLQTASPSVRPQASGKSVLEWQDVGERAGKSCVCVMAMAYPEKIGLEKSIGRECYEDDSCPLCRGFGTIECPVRACKRGSIMTSVPELVGKNPNTGQETYLEKHISVPCAACFGFGRVRCFLCKSTGVDPELVGRPASQLLSTVNPIAIKELGLPSADSLPDPEAMQKGGMAPGAPGNGQQPGAAPGPARPAVQGLPPAPGAQPAPLRRKK